MKKFKMILDCEKEESYLNEMAAKGYMFKKRSLLGGYIFEETISQTLNFKVDFRIFQKPKDYMSYKLLFKDAGWLMVNGSKYCGSQYFLKVKDNANEEIFSDQISVNNRQKRLAKFSMMCFLLCIMYVLIVFFAIPNSIYYKEVFLKSNLLLLNDSNVWNTFLIELPFTLLYFMIYIIVLASGIVVGLLTVISTLKYLRLRRKTAV